MSYSRIRAGRAKERSKQFPAYLFRNGNVKGRIVTGRSSYAYSGGHAARRPATDKQVAVLNIHVFRIADGKVVEHSRYATTSAWCDK
jgi:hypothetical protein